MTALTADLASSTLYRRTACWLMRRKTIALLITFVLVLGAWSASMLLPISPSGKQAVATTSVQYQPRPGNQTQEVPDIESGLATNATNIVQPEMEVEGNYFFETGLKVDGRIWPLEPNAMESLILSELYQAALDRGIHILSVNSNVCSTMRCEIRLFASTDLEFDTTGEAPVRLGLEWDTLANEPYSAIVSVVTTVTDAGQIERLVRFSSDHMEFPVETKRRLSTELKGLGETALESASFDAAPSRFDFRGGEFVVENVCSYNCPLDTRMIIHHVIPEGMSCRRMAGVERIIVTRTESGSFAERTYCVPSVLVED